MILQPHRSEILPYFERLMPEYREYCESVSKRSMALSIETCAYLWWLCDLKQARTVADLGSGFTSYVLRRYAAEAGHDVVVHSADSDRVWLQHSVDFVEGHELNTDGFYLGEHWAEMDARYDVIINDYSSGRTREQFASLAIERIAPAGVVMFDDAQNADHHKYFAEACHANGLTLLDVWHQTVDEVGRFAVVGVRL